MENIKQGLNDYLGFDYMDFYKDSYYNDFIYIYGGCLRDIISGNKINDVDIMCSTQAIVNVIEPLLISNGYTKIEKFSIDISSAYLSTNLLFEPISYTKNGSIVQLIRPSGSVINDTNYGIGAISGPTEVMNKLMTLIGNVDITCCGLYLNHNGLFETVKEAYLDCVLKHYYINFDAKFYNHRRIDVREYKMSTIKGFTKITDSLRTMRENMKIIMEMDKSYYANVCPFIYTVVDYNKNQEYLPF